MRLKRIKNEVAALMATLIVGGTLLAGVHAAAQSFGGMSMLDLEADRDTYFQSADHDGDFALSTEEQLSAATNRHADLYECWDSDGDGLCSYSEFLDSGEKIFNHLDVNGDGHLSPDELQ